ncbi:MAG: hypothetical protein ACI9UJ_001419 [bacterium]|jgi:hypothetical protein
MIDMKYTLYLTLLAFFLINPAIGYGQDETDPEEKPVITLTPVGNPKLIMSETEHDFGSIEPSVKVTHVFTFVNEGSAPLVISKINTPCGCTAPSWSKEPIEPGKTGEIIVTFNSAGKVGNQIKTLSIIYNSEMSPTMFTIKANVKPPSNN